MGCRHKVKLDTEMIKRNLPILQKGDHIQMPLKNCLLGTFLSHHAIVDEFKVDEGKVTDFCVIEIPDKGGFREKNLRIERNKCDVDLDQIELIEYRKRKYDHTETYFRALKVADHDLQRADQNRKSTNGSINTSESTTSTNVKPNNAQKPPYNVFRRNCEHFASACVNGPSRFSSDNVDQSTSLQSTKCWWIFFDIIIFLFQCSFFLTNFYIYAVYVKKDERYNHFPAWFMEFIDRLHCYHPERDEKGFKTDCDWKALGLFFGLFVLIFVFLLLYQYCCLIKKHKCVCEECLMARKILYCAKALHFVIFEIINIYLERPLFNIIDCLNYDSVFILFVFIIICAIEAVIVTLAASILTRYFIRYISFPCCTRCITMCSMRCTKCTRWCSDGGCTCRFEEDAYKYVVRNITCHDVSLCLDSCFLCLTCCRGNENTTAQLKNRSHTV